MAIFNENGDPKWLQFCGGRKFLLALICLGLTAWGFFSTLKLDGYQFGGIILTALGLYAYNNRKQKELEIPSADDAGRSSSPSKTSQQASEPALRK
jgi:hypothetical protein